METLPIELYDHILTFFPIRDFLRFRLISTFYESSQSYDGTIRTDLPKHPRWKRMFPKANCVLHASPVHEAHFNDYIHLEKLTLNHIPILQETAFAQLPDLHILEVWSSHWDHYRARVQHVTIPMFRHLSKLHTLKLFSNFDITDEALSYLPQLKRLLLDHCKEITSKGIQYLKQLVDLHLYSQPRITNEAFEGLPIQTLYVNQNALITDQGILSLRHLQKLTTFKTPHIRGDGFQTLPRLTAVYLNGVTISDYSNFKHVRSLILNHCTLPNDDYEKWKSLQTLQIYNAFMAYPTALFKVSLAPHLSHFTIEHCPCMVPYEAMLKQYFGEKLLCKHLKDLHPMY